MENRNYFKLKEKYLYMQKGKFIVVEGLDGSGSTTQAILLTSYLFKKDKKNVPVLSREPTLLTPYGCEIRRRLTRNLLSQEEEIHDFGYWANLFVKDRIWHLENVVNYNTNLGLTVISDRHMLSTLAYQSAQGGDMKRLIKLHFGLRKPDLTLYLDVPVDVALKRIQKNREGSPEYFEKKSFLERTANNYETAISLVGTKQNVKIINSNLPLEETETLIIKEVNKLFNYD